MKFALEGTLLIPHGKSVLPYPSHRMILYEYHTRPLLYDTPQRRSYMIIPPDSPHGITFPMVGSNDLISRASMMYPQCLIRTALLIIIHEHRSGCSHKHNLTHNYMLMRLSKAIIEHDLTIGLVCDTILSGMKKRLGVIHMSHENIRCGLCGGKFVVGDKAMFAHDGTNLYIVCEECDRNALTEFTPEGQMETS